MNRSCFENSHYNERSFLLALKESLSLDLAEKKRVLDHYFADKLSSFQIWALMNVFEEEIEKFSLLGQENPKDMVILIRNADEIWNELCKNYDQKLPKLTLESERFMKLQQTCFKGIEKFG